MITVLVQSIVNVVTEIIDSCFEKALFSSVNSLYNYYENTAIGSKSMMGNISGYENTACGFQTLKSDQNGLRNTAIGFKSLYSSNGSLRNTGVGASSLFKNQTGNDNVASF